MKYRTTRKMIVNGTRADELFRCGYCDMWHILRNHEPIAYTCGIYGWNFDVYEVYGITITTGYRNMCGKNIPYDLIRSYEGKAKEIFDDYSIPYEERKERIESLLKEFCGKLKGE